MGNKQTYNRLLALLLAALCLFVCVTTALPSDDMAHECVGEQCFLCLCLSLRQNPAALSVLPVGLCVLVYFIFKCGIHLPCAIVPAFWSPVCLKVKLSD